MVLSFTIVDMAFLTQAFQGKLRGGEKVVIHVDSPDAS